MKKIAMVIFDNFTDLDLFLMWDIFGREKADWIIGKMVGEKKMRKSLREIFPVGQQDIYEKLLITSIQ